MRLKKFKIILSLIICCWLIGNNFAFAEKIDDLKAKIEERNKQIMEIQKEIDQYQQEIDKNSKDASTLKQKINTLEATKKKFAADISVTQKQIESTGFVIESLALEIQDKEKDILNKTDVIAEIIRNMNDAESTSVVELVLSRDSFSDFFNDVQRMENLQKEIKITLDDLRSTKEVLGQQKGEKESKKNDLEVFQDKLIDQKQLVEINKKNTDNLLRETKNKEAAYKKLLADRLAKQQALEDEIRDFENQIKIAIDPKSLPSSGSGVLKWPLDNVVITQYFGNTPFATQNPQVYNGNGHNGVDFRASPGTPLKASASGVVRAVGNTDETCKGVSYGKWVLIDHPNNLSTLYAHLSLIKVSAGQNVEIGQIIGYSGDTGYCTGPHLHFGVFASQGVEIGQIKSKICGTMMRLPVASYNSYLNPLSYL